MNVYTFFEFFVLMQAVGLRFTTILSSARLSVFCTPRFLHSPFFLSSTSSRRYNFQSVWFPSADFFVKKTQSMTDLKIVDEEFTKLQLKIKEQVSRRSKRSETSIIFQVLKA